MTCKGGSGAAIQLKIENLDKDTALIEKWTNGGDRETVLLGEAGETPTDVLRNIVRQIREVFNYWRERMSELEDPVALDSGIWNVRRSRILTEEIPAGGLLTLPVWYYPTRDIMLLMIDNIPFTPTKPDNWDEGQRQYAEVGDDKTVLSNQVTVSMTLPVGTAVDVWVISSNLFKAMDEILAAAEQAGQDAAAAEVSATNAASAADAAQASANAAAASAALAESTARETATDIINSMLPADIGAVAASELTSVLTDAQYSGTASTVQVNLDVYNAETGTSAQVQRTFPIAGPGQAGAMPAETFETVADHEARLQAIEGAGGHWAGQDFETHADLINWSVPDTVKIGDFSNINTDETHNQETWRYGYRGAGANPLWSAQYRVNEAPIGIAKPTILGLVKGVAATAPKWKVFIENDGTGTVIGGDATDTNIANLNTGLAGKAPANITLEDQTANDTLPSAASQAIQAILQIFRNNIKSLQSKTASTPASAPIKRETLTTALAAGANYAVPAYKVGSGRLKVSVDGMGDLMGASAATGLWYEVGAAETQSTTVRFFEALPVGTQITSESSI
ncbi:MAG: hypothetical protein LBV80_07785 [Deltaproteobacteria bacterium]|jgi:hypothetical protein|nr:hypothetical protein [Deltaproteobacteria bacterium]